MYVDRNIKWSIILGFAKNYLIVFLIWNFIVFFGIHALEHQGYSTHIPFLPLSTIGIAVAFYLGFKNNAAYDRFWEARKIWGGIVNYSRTWGNQVLSFVSDRHANENISDNELYAAQQRLIYRHLAWINALRLQLRKPNPNAIKVNKSVKKRLLLNAPEDNHWKNEVFALVPDGECVALYPTVNKATQLLRKQGEDLRILMEEKGLIEDFRHMEMMRVLEEFYNLQGKCERIKGTPFPRQYGYFSMLFTWIFILLLPFGMLGQFADMGHDMQWLSIPFCILVSWIFITMELIGDNSEDPFEGFVNDVPMNAICRTIEIDLREMLGEEDLPERVAPVNGVLM